MSNNKLLLPMIAVGGLLVVGAAGAGGWLYLRHGDPMKRAQELIAQGDLKGAQIEMRNAVRDHPDNAQAHLQLGELQIQANDLVAAEKELKSARDQGADRWVVTSLLGQVYIAQHRYADVLTEVPVEAPTPEVVAKNLILRAMAQYGLNDMPAATASLVAAEKAAPNNVEVLLAAARLALSNRTLPLAEQKVNEALKLDATNVDGLLLRAQVMLARNDTPGALAALDAAVAAHPDSAAARLNRANQMVLAGQDAKAQADLDVILKGQARNAAATYLNAILMVRAGKYAEAQPELAKLGPVLQRFPRTLYFQALAAANLGQTEAAIDFANRYVVRVPADADGVRLLARTELTARHADLAVAALTKAVAGGIQDAQTLDLLGRAYAMLGKNTDAVAAFKQASQAAPEDATILTHLASSQMQEGNPANATAALERSLAIAPQQPNAGEALVAASLSAGDMDKADAALAQLRAQQGESEAVGILGGMVRLGRLDLEGARAAFANTLKLFPESLNAKLNLGKVLILQGRRPEGEAMLREVLAKDPANLATLNTMIQLLVQQNQFTQAIQLVEAARAATPTNLSLVSTLSDLLVRAGDPGRAAAMLQTMRAKEDLPPILLGALARAQAAAGMSTEALATYAALRQKTPTDLDALRGQVDLLLKAGKLDEANNALRDGLKSSPGNLGIMSALVALATRANGADAGLKVADELRNATVNLPNSAVLKGDALMAAGRFPEAAATFLTEYKLTPTAPLVIRTTNALNAAGKADDGAALLRAWQKDNTPDADVSQMLALLDIKAHRLDDAEKNLSDVLAARPADPVAMNNLAWVYSQKRDPRARTLAQRAYLQNPSPETADTLGWVMVQNNDAKSGLPLLQQGAAQRPTDLSIRYHLAVAQRDTGDTAGAIQTLEPIVNGPIAFDDKPAATKLLSDLKK